DVLRGLRHPALAALHLSVVGQRAVRGPRADSDRRGAADLALLRRRTGGDRRDLPDAPPLDLDDHGLCALCRDLRRLGALPLDLDDPEVRHAHRAGLLPDRRRDHLDRGDLEPEGNRLRRSRLMQIRFDGKTVIVAGAARGIGRAITRAFAADGGNVFACDRLVNEIEARERVKALAVDVTDARSIDAVVAAAGGKVDVLVYVAGGILGQVPKPLEEVQPEEFAGIVDVNLKGCFLFARAVTPS